MDKKLNIEDLSCTAKAGGKKCPYRTNISDAGKYSNIK